MDAIVPIFIVITVVVSWLVNLGKQNEQKQRREERLRQRRERAGGDGRAKANDFMNEGQRRQQAVQRGRGDSSDDVEIVQQPRTRRPPKQTRNREEVWREQTGRGRQRGQKSQQPARPTTQQRTPQPVARPVEQPAAPIRPQPSSLASRHVDSSVGKSSLTHLSEKRLDDSLAQQVSQDMGVFGAIAATSTGAMAQSETTRRRQSPAAGLRNVLRSSQSVRQAVIISEVLSLPVALR